MKVLLIKEYILFAKGIIRKFAISSEASMYYRRTFNDYYVEYKRIRSARLQYIILDEDIVCPCMRVHEVHKRTG